MLTHTMDSIRRDSPTQKRPKTSDKRPWDSPGAFSYAVYALQIPLEGPLPVFFGYALASPLSLFDFLANAALNRLSEALRLSQPSDFRATPRLSATLGERLPRRLSDSKRLPPTLRLPATLRLSATFDFLHPNRGGLCTILPRAAIPPGMPERRAAVAIARAAGRNDRQHRG